MTSDPRSFLGRTPNPDEERAIYAEKERAEIENRLFTMQRELQQGYIDGMVRALKPFLPEPPPTPEQLAMEAAEIRGRMRAMMTASALTGINAWTDLANGRKSPDSTWEQAAAQQAVAIADAVLKELGL